MANEHKDYMDENATKFWAGFGANTVQANDFTKKLKEAFANTSGDFVQRVVTLLIDAQQTGSVTKEHFGDFLARFGPFEHCMDKAHGVFMDEMVIYPWFHGEVSSDHVKQLLHTPGFFLVRMSGHEREGFPLQYASSKDGKLGIRKLFVKNTAKGVECHELLPAKTYSTVAALIDEAKVKCVTPVYSRLHKKSVEMLPENLRQKFVTLDDGKGYSQEDGYTKDSGYENEPISGGGGGAKGYENAT